MQATAVKNSSSLLYTLDVSLNYYTMSLVKNIYGRPYVSDTMYFMCKTSFSDNFAASHYFVFVFAVVVCLSVFFFLQGSLYLPIHLYAPVDVIKFCTVSLSIRLFDV